MTRAPVSDVARAELAPAVLLQDLDRERDEREDDVDAGERERANDDIDLEVEFPLEEED